MINNVTKIGESQYSYNQKQANGTLSHEEWNDISQAVDVAHTKIDEIIQNGISEVPEQQGGNNSIVTSTQDTTDDDPKAVITIASGVSEVGSPAILELTKKKKGVNTTLTAGNNINIEPRESVGENKGGNISLKPGDDIEFCSHHRLADNQNEVSVKVVDGDSVPVKLQLNTSELLLTTKIDKNTPGGDLNVTVNKNTDTRGYLKVRAQAIDLRCEDHGGIALQPKGEDSGHHMNKIKFEHGGGDGLEFGTFNAEKTSIFTDEYRFNKDGVWKMATRTKVARANDDSKRDASDSTTHYTYVKADDDFYDNILPIDSVATTEQIINTANALNGSGVRSTNQTNLLRIKTEECFTVIHNANLYNIYYTSEAPSGFSGFQTYAVRNLTTEQITSISRIENQTSIKEFLNVPESISNTVLNTDIVSIGNKLLIELYGEQSENPDGYFVVKLVSSIPSENVFSITGTYDAENDNGNLDSIVDLKSAFVDGKEYTFEELTKDFTIALQKAYYQLTGRTSYNTNLTSFQTDFAEALTNTFSTTKLIQIHGAGNRNLVYIARFGYDEGAKDIWIEGGDEVKLESTRLVRMTAPNSIALSSGNVINITSEGNLTLQSNSGKVNINGELDFGDTFNFGETEDGIQTQRKLTKGGNTKPCDTIKVVGVNNHTSNNLTVDGWDSQNNAITTYTIAPGNTQTLAECSLLDVILLTNYMKTHQEGPWATQL